MCWFHGVLVLRCGRDETVAGAIQDEECVVGGFLVELGVESAFAVDVSSGLARDDGAVSVFVECDEDFCLRVAF